MIKLLIKVKPNSAVDKISIGPENDITVKIKAKPIDGEANEYLINYLAKEFEISRSLIQIEKGAVSRSKRILLFIEPSKWEEIIIKQKK